MVHQLYDYNAKYTLVTRRLLVYKLQLIFFCVFFLFIFSYKLTDL